MGVYYYVITNTVAERGRSCIYRKPYISCLDYASGHLYCRWQARLPVRSASCSNRDPSTQQSIRPVRLPSRLVALGYAILCTNCSSRLQSANCNGLFSALALPYKSTRLSIGGAAAKSKRIFFCQYTAFKPLLLGLTTSTLSPGTATSGLRHSKSNGLVTRLFPLYHLLLNWLYGIRISFLLPGHILLFATWESTRLVASKCLCRSGSNHA